MDPKVAWLNLLKSLKAGELYEATDFSSNLAEWLHRGGAMPDIEPKDFAFVLSHLAVYLARAERENDFHRAKNGMA
jgi:hypothetical protein